MWQGLTSMGVVFTSLNLCKIVPHVVCVKEDPENVVALAVGWIQSGAVGTRTSVHTRCQGLNPLHHDVSPPLQSLKKQIFAHEPSRMDLFLVLWEM